MKRKYNPRVQGCNSLHNNYELLERIHEGTYGEVYKAKEKSTGHFKAIKKVKKESNFGKDGISIVFLREINLLRSINHPNIVKIDEIVLDYQTEEPQINIIMEYVPHELRYLNKHLGKTFSISQTKRIMFQLLSGLAELHKRYIFHRDLKTSNILYDHNGIIKICDFGLARRYTDVQKCYSGNVVTLWYRAPELLLRTKNYSAEIDMWSMGIIFAEILLNDVPFKADSEIRMFEKIINSLGTPDSLEFPEFGDLLMKNNIPNWSRKADGYLFNQLRAKGLSEDGLGLFRKMLHFNPKIRITAEEALKHAWFLEDPKPCPLENMPKFAEVKREKK